ncbi:uncharacterized protein [Argopecten irradians]|uniref:uncharacterized protein isoform X2 n=1 Tax=Argopecten irradians TaxID=31199 RepID=UPI00371003F4
MLIQSRTENAVTAHQKSGTETTVIALGVVAGVAILALVITLAFLCLRQRRKRSAPPANDYTDMNCPLGLPSKLEPLHGISETKNRESAMYLDIDDAEMEKANQGTQQDHGAMDNVYNSIDDCGDDKGYAQPDDLLMKLTSESKRLDQMHGQENYFVLEKQDENHEDQTNAESYFVLDKSENKSLGNVQTENESGNANRTDNYFILEEQENMQQNAENVSGDDYFLLEKEGNVEEDRTIDGTYNTLNTEIDIGCTDDDYSHARTVCSSEESKPREGSADEEDYDKLFQKPNTYVVRDSDNDYDHMKTKTFKL